MPSVFPPNFGPPFRNNPAIVALNGNPIRLARVRLEENWPACGSAKATLYAWNMNQDGENNVFPGNQIGVILRDPLGQINWELAALQEPTGEFYLEAGLSLVVWQPEDASDGHWELLAVGSGCPIGSGSEEEGSGSEEEGSGSEGSEPEGSEPEGSEPEGSCIREEDIFLQTLPILDDPVWVLGKDANGCLGWVAFCRPCPEPCSEIIPGTVPRVLFVTVAGVVNSICDPGDCETAWNRQHALYQDPADPCRWREDFQFTCGVDVMDCSLTAEVIAGTLTIFTESHGAHTGAAFTRALVQDPANGLTDLLGDVPLGTNDNFVCDFTAGTCNVDGVA